MTIPHVPAIGNAANDEEIVIGFTARRSQIRRHHADNRPATVVVDSLYDIESPPKSRCHKP
jgi:hypothetical protein